MGSSGAFDNLTYYHDSLMATVDADETTTYSVMTNNSTTLLLCLNSSITGVTAQGSADGLVSGTESDCCTVDAAGNATLATITITINGITVKFK
jgi:hypothetical protein